MNVVSSTDFLTLIGNLLQNVTTKPASDLSGAVGKPAGNSLAIATDPTKDPTSGKGPKVKDPNAEDLLPDASGATLTNIVTNATKPILLTLNLDLNFQLRPQQPTETTAAPAAGIGTPVTTLSNTTSSLIPQIPVPTPPTARPQQDPATNLMGGNVAFRVMIQPVTSNAPAPEKLASDVTPTLSGANNTNPVPVEMIGAKAQQQAPEAATPVNADKPAAPQSAGRPSPPATTKEAEPASNSVRPPEVTQSPEKPAAQPVVARPSADRRSDSEPDTPNQTNQAVTPTVPLQQTAHSVETKTASLPPQGPAVVATAPAVSLEPEPPKTVQAAPLREIAVRVQSETGGPNVDVHVVERSGNLSVDVRTADVDLTQSLRTNVGQLVTRLEETGFKSHTSLPVSAISQLSSAGQASQQSNTGTGSDANSDGKHAFQPDHDQNHQPGRRAREAWEQYFNDTLNDDTKARNF